MKPITSQTNIQISSQELWQILLDSRGYAEWNPVFLDLSPQPVEGKCVTLQLRILTSTILAYLEEESYADMLSSIPIRKRKLRHRVLRMEEGICLVLELSGWQRLFGYQQLEFQLTPIEEQLTEIRFRFSIGGLMKLIVPLEFFEAYIGAMTRAFLAELKGYVEERELAKLRKIGETNA